MYAVLRCGIFCDLIVYAGHNALAFFNHENAVNAGEMNVFHGTIGPVDFYIIYGRCLSQAKMKPLRA